MSDMNKSSFADLLKHVKHIKIKVIFASLCSILNKLCDLVPPILIGITIDLVVSKENSIISRFGIKDITSQLIIICCLTVLVWGLESLFEYFSRVLWGNIAQTFQHNLRMETYEYVQELDLSCFEELNVGNISNIINNDINQLENFLNDSIHQIIQLIVTYIFVGGFFLFTIHSIALLLVIPMPFIMLVANKYQKMIAPKYDRVREDTALLNTQLINNFEGIATIKSYATENFETKRVHELSEAYLKSNKRAIRISGAFVPVVRMVIVVGYVMSLMISGKMALSGDLNVGIFSTLIYMSERILWPLVGVGQLFDTYQKSLACVKRVLNLFQIKKVIKDGDIKLPEDSNIGDINIKNVTFHYNKSPNILNNISLDIKKGETIGIVGNTGSGKSTLLKLLLRFYDVENGQVLIDGVDIKEYVLSDLRSRIAYISQDILIFHGTVRENIAYGSPSAKDSDTVQAAMVAEAHEFISKLPNGYDTVIGERGQNLSGGQKQRLSIARAVLKNSPIILLDEATSALDNETEAAIQVSLERICKDRTSIIVAHRLSTIRNADRIVVLEGGRIIEIGNHEELIRKNGVYAKQWMIQTGNRKKDQMQESFAL